LSYFQALHSPVGRSSCTQCTVHACTHTLPPGLWRNTLTAKNWTILAAAKTYGRLNMHSPLTHPHTHAFTFDNAYKLSHMRPTTPDTNKNCVRFVSQYIRCFSEPRNENQSRHKNHVFIDFKTCTVDFSGFTFEDAQVSHVRRGLVDKYFS